METPKKTYGKQGGRPKVSIGRIRKYVVSTRLSPERKLRFSALCREVRYEVNGRAFFAVGFRNDAGGWELRSERFKGVNKVQE